MRRPRRKMHSSLSNVSSTGGRLTHVRDPRATARFSLDEQVGWDEGDRVEDGSVVLWPTFSARLKRVQTGDFGSDHDADIHVDGEHGDDEPTRVPGMTNPGPGRRTLIGR